VSKIYDYLRKRELERQLVRFLDEMEDLLPI
jgi:hypothetical protein